MKKYFLKETGEPLKFGDTITVQGMADSPFGEVPAEFKIVFSEETLDKLLERGAVKVVEKKSSKIKKKEEEEEEEEKLDSFVEAIKPYVEKFTEDNDLSYGAACLLLKVTLDFCPKVHLNMLLETVADAKKDEHEGPKEHWFLNPWQDYRVTKLPEGNVGFITFPSKRAATEAYELLEPIIDRVINGE